MKGRSEGRASDCSRSSSWLVNDLQVVLRASTLFPHQLIWCVCSSAGSRLEEKRVRPVGAAAAAAGVPASGVTDPMIAGKKQDH